MPKKLTDYLKKENEVVDAEEPMDEDGKLLEMYHMLDDQDKAEVMDMVQELCYAKKPEGNGDMKNGMKGKSGALVITIGK